MFSIKKILISLIFVFICISPFNTLIVYADTPTPTPALSFDLVDLDLSFNEGDNSISIEQYKDEEVTKLGWNTIYEKYNGILVGISGILSLTFILFFIMNVFKLASSAHNSQERSKVVKNLLFTGIGAGGFMSITLLMGIAFALFGKTPSEDTVTEP